MSGYSYSGATLDHYGYGTEEHHIAATIIQCMVRRDQAIMFVDVLWEQTAAALSLQSIVRAFLARKKYLQMLSTMDQPSSLNKYQQRNPPRADSRASQLSSTQWSSDFDESEWEERYYQSSPEPSMVPASKKNINNQGMTKQSLAFYDNQQQTPPLDNNDVKKFPENVPSQSQRLNNNDAGLKSVPSTGSVAAQRKAIELAERQKKLEEAKEEAERKERALERRRRAEAKQRIRLEQIEREKQQQEQPSQVPVEQAREQPPPSSVPQPPMYSNVGPPATPESEDSQPISPTLARLQNQGQVKRTADRLATKTPDIPEGAPLTSGDNSPLRQRLDGSGVAMRAAASLRTESMDRVASRPPSRQNDTEEVVAQGALLRAAESFGSSLQKTQNRVTENDAAAVAVPGVAAQRAAKFEQDAAWAAAAKWRDMAAEHARTKPFKFELSDNSVAPMIGFGSAFEPGMQDQKAKRQSGNSITLGAAGAGEYVKDSQLSLFGSGSTSAPGMVQMRSNGDDITRGAAAGKSIHQGGTFATSGSLNAPGMGKGKYVSPEVAGSAGGASVHQGGTLLTNGSVHAPGMVSNNSNKNSGNKYGGTSCDTGISLFGMGSTLSQANFEETRQKLGAGNADFDVHQSVSSTDLPLWSLGSSISVAAMEDQKHRQSMANSITFGATAGGYGHKNNAGSSAVSLWSLGSSQTTGMSRGSLGVRTNTNGASSQALGSATLMSFGSSGTPGMQRDIPTSSVQPVVCSSEPSLLMMGSTNTAGMQVIKNDHGNNGSRNILPGGNQSDPDAEYQGGSSRYTGTKWKVGNHGAATLAMNESNYTSQKAMMVSSQSAVGGLNNQQSKIDHDKMVSVDKSGGGTLSTSGSHATMGRRNASEVDGAGRSITYGAEVTGKSVYSGPTFSTGGSAALNSKPNKIVEQKMLSNAKPTVHRPPNSPKQQVSMGRQSALAKVPPPVPAVSAYEYQRKHEESGPLPPSVSNRRGRSPEKSFSYNNYTNDDEENDDRSNRGNSISLRRNRSPDKLLNQSTSGGGSSRTSAGQQAVDRAMARAKAAAAVIAASQSEPTPTTSRRYESTIRRGEDQPSSTTRRYDSTRRDERSTTTGRNLRSESNTRQNDREEYDSFDNEQISSASILRDALRKKREQPSASKQYGSYSRDLPPAPPSESDLYSDLSSTYSSSNINQDESISSHRHHNNNGNSRRNIIEKLLNTDKLVGTEEGRERRERARLERQAARQARSLAATSQTSDSYSYEPSTSSRRHRALMV